MAINIQKYSLKVVKESGGRYDLEKEISTPNSAMQVFTEVLELDRKSEEVFAILTLDVKSQLTGVFEVSKGSLSSSIVTPREVFKRAILQNSKAIILAHNHPSGDPKPSGDDIQITERLVEAGDLLGINVFDHLIIGSSSNFVSLKERGDM
mgnify:CR=1 FL=1